MSNRSEALKAKYGSDYFSRIGKKGGVNNKAAGADFTKIGRLGGQQTLARWGKEHFSRARRGEKSKE